MFVSRTENGVTTSIRVDVVTDLFWGVGALVLGAAMLVAAIHDGLRLHPALAGIGGLLALGGWRLTRSTIALIGRARRAYRDATN